MALRLMLIRRSVFTSTHLMLIIEVAETSMIQLIRGMPTSGVRTRAAGNGRQGKLTTVTHHFAVAMAKDGENRRSPTTGYILAANLQTEDEQSKTTTGVAIGTTESPVVV